MEEHALPVAGAPQGGFLFRPDDESVGSGPQMGRTIVQRWVRDVRVVVRTTTLPAPDEVDDHVREALEMADRTRVVLVAVVGDGARA